METKTSVSIRRHTFEWVLTILPIGAFVLVYVWVVMFSNQHSKVGNLALWFLMWCGAFIAAFVFIRISNTHESISWSQMKSIPLWTIVGFLVIGLWHAVGGIFITSTDVQHWFVYGPLVALLGVIFLGFMKHMNEYAKNH